MPIIVISFFMVGITLSDAPVCHFAWKEKWSLHGLWPKVWLGSQGFRRYMENCWQRNLGKIHVDKHFWTGENAKIFVSHLNVLLRVTSENNNFNNQMDRMTHFVDTSQFLSPATLSSLLLLTGFMNQVAIVSGIEVMPWLSNMDFYSLRITWLEPLLRAQFFGRDQYWAPNMGPFPKVISQLPGGRLIILDLLHHGRSSILSLREYIFTPCYASPKITICGLKEFLIHSHSILHSHAIIHFTENEVGMFLEFIGLTVLPTMLKQLSLNGGMAFWRLNYSSR